MPDTPPTPTPPEGWEPAVGDVVAVRACLLSAIPGHDSYDVGLRRTRSRHELAPWLPAEDHAALLRLRDAAKALDIFTAEDHYDAGEGQCWSCSEDFPCAWVEYGAALAATEHIR